MCECERNVEVKDNTHQASRQQRGQEGGHGVLKREEDDWRSRNVLLMHSTRSAKKPIAVWRRPKTGVAPFRVEARHSQGQILNVTLRLRSDAWTRLGRRRPGGVEYSKVAARAEH